VREVMVKIVGKLSIFFLGFFFVSLPAQVTLRIQDTAGNTLQQACVGEPFMLEVEVADAHNSMQVPTIIGLDRFVAKRTGLYIHTVNGKSLAKYSYRVRIDQPGIYEIGPAVITDHNKKQASQIVTVNVGDQSMSSTVTTSKKEQRRHKRELLRLLVDNNNVVVGQKVTCALRFYYNKNAIELRQIGKPEITNAEIKDMEGVENGTELINGVSYKYVEWHWHLYPSQPGKMVIPAYSIDFDIQKKQAHALGSLSLFFGPRAERKRIYSNAVSLHVDPLPPYDGSVQAIGDFRKIEAHIKPAVVKEGEAMVLALELEGDGDLAAIEIPQLTGLPEQLKYYKSNSSIIKTPDTTTLSKKQFEFIVQGIACGEWEIPSQSFAYFDTESRSYRTLQTTPLAVTIISQPASSGSAGLKQETKKTEGDTETVHSIYPFITQGPWYPVNEREAMSWRLFLFLGIMPLGVTFYRLLCAWLARYWQRNRPRRWQKRRAFRVARRQLKKAANQQDVAQIYHIFVTLIADCCSESTAQISSSFIKEQLYKTETPENIITMWDNFFARATEYAFMASYKDKSLKTAFFKQADQWVNRFEEVEW